MNWLNKTGAKIVLLIAPACIGCATVGGHRQYVVVHTKPENLELRVNGQSLGRTPFIAGFERGSSKELHFFDDHGHEQVRRIPGHYRWWRSLAGNLVFITFAPVGWIVDDLTGTAWRFDSKLNFDFSDTMQVAPPPLDHERPEVAIAPPTSGHANISDEVGRLIEKKLAHDHPEYEILPYDSTIDVFRGTGLDYDRSSDKEPMAEAFSRLSVNKIYFSSVDEHNKKVLVSGEITDGLNAGDSKKVDYEIPEEQVRAIHEIGSQSYQDLVYWLPNSIGVDFGQTATSFKIGDSTVNAHTSFEDSVLGQVSQVVSAISISRVFPPIDRPGWHYRLGFAPEVTLSDANETFALAGISRVSFDRLYVDAGWGPNFNFGNKYLNFYLNLIPVVAYSQIGANAFGTNYSVSSTDVTISSEAGIMYFFTPHWMARIYVHSASESRDLWQKIFSQVADQPVYIESANLSSEGVNVSYVFPGQALKFW
jgi:hypothetical protein